VYSTQPLISLTGDCSVGAPDGGACWATKGFVRASAGEAGCRRKEEQSMEEVRTVVKAKDETEEEEEEEVKGHFCEK